jgi:DNA processing protein
VNAGVLNDGEKRAWLRLARTPTIGPASFATLIARSGSARTALEDVPRLAGRGGGNVQIPSDAEAEREIAATAKLGGKILASCEPEYPTALAALEAPPPVITVLGRVELLAREAIAVVGARNASALGRKFAGTLAGDLGAAGLVVVSGLARGIDTAAHEGALASGTIAVLAGGADNIYPPENARLHARIRDEGAIVSEMPLAHVPQARHFPRRNRIIAGLARGVLIVEAAEGSGSLITANYALEQNREIFAVPGSPLDPRARGTNRLIRQGAVLTESAEDILAVLKPILGKGFGEPDRDRYAPKGEIGDTESTRIRRAIEEALGPSGVAIDELVRLIGAPVQEVLIVLLELELAGRITREPGNRVVWI